MRQDRVEFGPGRAQRAMMAVLLLLIVAGAVFVTRLGTAALALLPLLSLSPLLLSGIWAGTRPPTTVTADGVRFYRRGAVFQIRRERIPWAEISHIGTQQVRRNTYPSIRLTDGARLALHVPNQTRNRRDFAAAIGLLQHRHLEACGGSPPPVTGVPLPHRRVRVWVKAVSIALPVTTAILVVTWLVTTVRVDSWMSKVATCDYVPQDLAARFVPGGRIDDFGGGAPGCRWSPGPAWQSGTWLDLHIANTTREIAERSYDARRKAVAAHPVNGERDAYTTAWPDSWGFTAQGLARVDGYLVMVALHTKRVATAAEAERQAAELLRAVTRKLAS